MGPVVVEVVVVCRRASANVIVPASTLLSLAGGGGGSFDRVFDFPGGHTKFTIHRDPKTGIYLSIVNPNTNIAFADQVTTRKTEHARAWVWV